MKTIELKIEGMTCGHCLHAVQRALQGIPGATVQTLQIGRAVIETAPDGPSGDALAALVADAGYRATPEVMDASHA